MNDKSEADVGEGRYLYCAINHNISAETDFGNIGLENNRIYAILYKNISVLVHNCLAKPYESRKEEKAKSWLFSHLYVIDQAIKKFGTVVPFAFDTIIKGTEDNVIGWLSKEYPRLKNNLERLDGKAEYDIQIFLDVNSVSQEIESIDEEIQKLRKNIETKPKGVAHLLQKKLETILSNKLKKKVEEYSKKIHDQVKEYVEETRENKIIEMEIEKWKDKKMILNLSCLVHSNNIKALGDSLGQINNKGGISVRFSGPWAPFNFVR